MHASFFNNRMPDEIPQQATKLIASHTFDQLWSELFQVAPALCAEIVKQLARGTNCSHPERIAIINDLARAAQNLSPISLKRSEVTIELPELISQKSLRLSPGGQFLVLQEDRLLSFFSLSSMSVESFLDLKCSQQDQCWFTENDRLLITRSDGLTIHDTQRRRHIAQFRHIPVETGVVIDDTRRLLFTFTDLAPTYGYNLGRLDVIDLQSHRTVVSSPACHQNGRLRRGGCSPSHDPPLAALSPDGKYLVLGEHDAGELRVCEYPSLKTVSYFGREAQGIERIYFFDSETLLVCFSDRLAKVSFPEMVETQSLPVRGLVWTFTGDKSTAICQVPGPPMIIDLVNWRIAEVIHRVEKLAFHPDGDSAVHFVRPWPREGSIKRIFPSSSDSLMLSIEQLFHKERRQYTADDLSAMRKLPQAGWYSDDVLTRSRFLRQLDAAAEQARVPISVRAHENSAISVASELEQHKTGERFHDAIQFARLRHLDPSRTIMLGCDSRDGVDGTLDPSVDGVHSSGSGDCSSERFSMGNKLRILAARNIDEMTVGCFEELLEIRKSCSLNRLELEWVQFMESIWNSAVNPLPQELAKAPIVEPAAPPFGDTLASEYKSMIGSLRTAGDGETVLYLMRFGAVPEFIVDANVPDEYLLCQALNASLPAQWRSPFLNRLASSTRITSRILAAESADTPFQTVEILAGDSELIVRLAAQSNHLCSNLVRLEVERNLRLARSAGITTAMLRELSLSRFAAVRAAVAERLCPSIKRKSYQQKRFEAPLQFLKKPYVVRHWEFLFDEEFSYRVAAMTNECCPLLDQTLARLHNPSINNLIAERNNFPSEVLEIFRLENRGSGGSRVQPRIVEAVLPVTLAAPSPPVGEQATYLAESAKNSNPLSRFCIISHPACPPAVTSGMEHSVHWYERLAIVVNPTSEPSVLQALSIDSNQVIAALAQERLSRKKSATCAKIPCFTAVPAGTTDLSPAEHTSHGDGSAADELIDLSLDELWKKVLNGVPALSIRIIDFLIEQRYEFPQCIKNQVELIRQLATESKLPDPEPFSTVEYSFPGTTYKLSPDGRFLISKSQGHNSLITLEDHIEAGRLPHTEPHLYFNRGDRVAATVQQNKVVVHDLDAMSQLDEFSSTDDSIITDLYFDNAGLLYEMSTLALDQRARTKLRIRSYLDHEFVAEHYIHLQHVRYFQTSCAPTDLPTVFAVSANGSYAIAGDQDLSVLHLYELPSFREIERLLIGRASVWLAEFLPSEKLCVVDHKVRWFSFPKCAEETSELLSMMNEFGFSNDRTLLAASPTPLVGYGTADKTVVIDLLRPRRAEVIQCNTTVFHPSGDSLVAVPVQRRYHQGAYQSCSVRRFFPAQDIQMCQLAKRLLRTALFDYTAEDVKQLGGLPARGWHSKQLLATSKFLKLLWRTRQMCLGL